MPIPAWIAPDLARVVLGQKGCRLRAVCCSFLVVCIAVGIAALSGFGGLPRVVEPFGDLYWRPRRLGWVAVSS